MNFVSPEFLFFLLFVFFVYWHLGRRNQNLFLLFASYFFYANWDWRFLSLIMVSTAVDFIAGPKIHSAENGRIRKAWLILSLGVNLGILGYFKYFNFFADSFVALLEGVGWNVSHSTAHIILPVGISFYTFQTLSYSIDIYRRQLKPTPSLVEFAAFVAFFPQLVAGPIVRAKEFLFQLEAERTLTGQDIEEGASRFLLGFFKKAFIADTLAIHLVDPVFAAPGEFSSGTLWLAVLGYSVQIYADFSGYSNMAIGSARLLGFRIPENFLFPYLATNFSDFWRRWHMTMSRFFRDYVYIGLGGNRNGFPRTLRNLAVTTLVSGLWHGAAWTFVAWGGLHGVFIATYQIWRHLKKTLGLGRVRGPGRGRSPGKGQGLGQGRSSETVTALGRFWFAIPAWALTQLCVGFAWVLFRSDSFEHAWAFLEGMFTRQGESLTGLGLLVWIALGAAIFDHAYGWIQEHRPGVVERVSPVLRGLVYAAMIVFLYSAIPQNANPFIYFQF